MTHFICKTCGVQHAGPAAPAHCAICDDERQYVRLSGQQWIGPDELKHTHNNLIKLEEPGLTGIGIAPHFGIGQRALLVQTAMGNVLWDCVPLLDDDAIAQVKALGGISAITVSHPHFYSAIVDWSKAFGDVPVYLHASNRPFVMRPHANIKFWEGERLTLLDGVTAIRCGGHFPGSCVLHWRQGAGGAGALLTGDTITCVPDRRVVSFMYSYPNLIPLNARAINGILASLSDVPYDRLYGGWFTDVIPQRAKQAVQFSAERYLRAIAE